MPLGDSKVHIYDCQLEGNNWHITHQYTIDSKALKTD